MLDIILFGVTGVTGSFCIEYLHKLTKNKGRNLTWGVAGRSEEKIKRILEKRSRQRDVDLSAIPIFIADINDHQSLVAMTRQTKSLLNCCGPYRHTGKFVVEACIETGTHYLDISAELDFAEYLETDCHEQAKEKGIYVLTSCGYDSIIFDNGLLYLQKNFQGVVNSVEGYFRMIYEKHLPGPSGNLTTWASVIDILSDYDAYKEVCKRATPKNLPKLLPVLEEKKFPHKPRNVDGWASPFLSNNKYVVAKTQEILYKMRNKRPVQLGFYQSQNSLITIIIFNIVHLLVLALSKYKLTRKWLLDYATIFTLGFIGTELNEEKMEKTGNSVTFYAEGWKKQTLENQENEIDICRPVDSCISMVISGYNHGYRMTALCLVVAGVILLTEKEKLGGNVKGGCHTPGILFEKTSVIEELMDNDIKINIQPQRDIQIK